MTNPYPSQRFVKLQYDTNHTITFTVSDENDKSAPEDSGIIQYIAENVPEKKAAALDLLTFLKANEDEFFTWLEASPEKSYLFAENPMKALATVFPDMPTFIGLTQNAG